MNLWAHWRTFCKHTFLHRLPLQGKKDYLSHYPLREKGEIKKQFYSTTPLSIVGISSNAWNEDLDLYGFHRRNWKIFMVQFGDDFSKEGLPPAEWPNDWTRIKPNHYPLEREPLLLDKDGWSNPMKRSNGMRQFILQSKSLPKRKIKGRFGKNSQPAFMQYVQRLEARSAWEEKWNTRVLQSRPNYSLTMLVDLQRGKKLRKKIAKSRIQ